MRIHPSPLKPSASNGVTFGWHGTISSSIIRASASRINRCRCLSVKTSGHSEVPGLASGYFRGAPSCRRQRKRIRHQFNGRKQRFEQITEASHCTVGRLREIIRCPIVSQASIDVLAAPVSVTASNGAIRQSNPRYRERGSLVHRDQSHRCTCCCTKNSRSVTARRLRGRHCQSAPASRVFGFTTD
jgi:hypothetical protein